MSGARAVRVVNLTQVSEFLIKAGVPKEKILYIPSLYIDLDIFKPMNLPKEYDLIFIGRLEKNKGLDDTFYKQLIIEYLKKNKSATKKDIVDLLDDKLSTILDDKQKLNKVKYLLHSMKTKNCSITTIDTNTKNVKWVLVK